MSADTRVYGADQRDRRAFEKLSPSQKAAAMAKWGSIYAWYLCEHTTTIAVALREGYPVQAICKQYKLTIDEVNKCQPLKG